MPRDDEGTKKTHYYSNILKKYSSDRRLLSNRSQECLRNLGRTSAGPPVTRLLYSCMYVKYLDEAEEKWMICWCQIEDNAFLAVYKTRFTYDPYKKIDLGRCVDAKIVNGIMSLTVRCSNRLNSKDSEGYEFIDENHDFKCNSVVLLKAWLRTIEEVRNAHRNEAN